MAEQIINAYTNPDLVNELVAKTLYEPEDTTPAELQNPTDVVVNLPGGLLGLTGEVSQTALVKELNGKDEEFIVKTPNFSRVYNAILSRGTVSVGSMPVTESILNGMLIGDRDAIMLGIYRATYGDTAILQSWCNSCGESSNVEVDVTKDIGTKVLLDPVGDRVFTIKGRKQEYVVTLPTGQVQNRMIESNGNTAEELSILLEGTILKIDGRPVISKSQVQELGMADRKKIAEEISARSPGPKLEDIQMECPSCGGELIVPINIWAMFRL